MTGVSGERDRVDALGGIFVGLAALQFGVVVILGKILANARFPTLSLLAIRFGLAAVIMVAILVAIRQPLAAAPGEGWRLAILGVAGYAVESSLFFSALHHGGAAAVTLLFFTYPVWVTLLSLAAGKGPPARLVLFSLVAAVGGASLVVVGSGGLEITNAGIAFAFGSALAFALYLTGADLVLKETNSLTGSMWVSGSAAIGLGALAVVTGSARLPHGSHQWVPIVIIAAFTAGAFICLFAGLRRLGAVRTSIVASTEPLVAAVLSVIFLGERLFGGTIAGGVLILVGAVTASLARAGRGAPPGRPGGSEAHLP